MECVATFRGLGRKDQRMRCRQEVIAGVESTAWPNMRGLPRTTNAEVTITAAQLACAHRWSGDRLGGRAACYVVVRGTIWEMRWWDRPSTLPMSRVVQPLSMRVRAASRSACSAWRRAAGGEPLKLPDDLLYWSGGVDLHGRGGSQQRLDNAKVLQNGFSVLRPLAIWIVGPRHDSGQQHLRGRAQQHDVVKLLVELPLIAHTAGHEQAVLLGQQDSHGLLAPYPVRRPIRQRDLVAPPAVVRIHSRVPP